MTRLKKRHTLGTPEEEAWRKTKKLGTLLGDSEEMRRRKQLASAAFHKLDTIWHRQKHNKISLAKRFRLHNAYVMPVLTYNACTWALTQSEMDELDAFRRSQLHRVVGITYPRKISNKALLEKFNTVELEHIIRGEC